MQQKRAGRKPITTEKIDARLLVWVPRSLHERLTNEALAAGYISVGAYIREKKLGGPAPAVRSRQEAMAS